MEAFKIALLILVTLIFLSVGRVIDYWQAAMEHKKKLPLFLKNYFMVIWLFIYTGFFPISLVFIASDFDLKITGIFIGSLSIASILWDISYSLLDTGKKVSYQEGYFVFKQKNYGLTIGQTQAWHLIRFLFGISCIIYFYSQF